MGLDGWVSFGIGWGRMGPGMEREVPGGRWASRRPIMRM